MATVTDILNKHQRPFTYGTDDCYSVCQDLVEHLTDGKKKLKRDTKLKWDTWPKDMVRAKKEYGSIRKGFAHNFLNFAGGALKKVKGDVMPGDIVIIGGNVELYGGALAYEAGVNGSLCGYVGDDCAVYTRATHGVVRVKGHKIQEIFRHG